jgi:hypothetical protein
LRLSDTSSLEASAVRALLGHRLSQSEVAAREEWSSIVDGSSPLWDAISTPYKDTIRAFLLHFYQEVLRKSAGQERQFAFANGSVGNFFFAGARTFFHSLDAALFLYARGARSRRSPQGVAVMPRPWRWAATLVASHCA